MTADATPRSDFIRDKIEKDNASGKFGGRVATRFPPEPNGYLHIGHAKSICLNFGIARDFGGVCHLRMDDTNPTTEDVEYVDAIVRDVKWLGFDWGEHQYFASDYYPYLYDGAVRLIEKGLAYVCDLTLDEVRKTRGTIKEAGTPSPYRSRSVAESLDLLARMKKGEFAEGSHTLRAKIDMASPNLKMRDPLMYRIKHAHHYRTGDTWHIYPIYDWAHCLSDAKERITHSICTLEFENNRELYDWYLNAVDAPWKPGQTEFARLNLSYTVMSKRKLLELVESKLVSGWDDPRMPTLAGFRRRGFTPASIRSFCDKIGVARADNTVDVALLEYAIREDLNTTAPRVMAVLKPVKVVIDNYPADQSEEFEAPYLPDDPTKLGARKVPFCRELYIERDDFMEVPAKKFHRLAPGAEVRLRWAYLITCRSVVKDAAGEITEIHCSYDPATRGGNTPDGRKVKGTIHWVSARHAFNAEVRLYDRLFKDEKPGDAPEGTPLAALLNPRALEVVKDAKLEPSLVAAAAGQNIQFERLGYFFVDPVDSKPGKPVFNRTVPLKDAWARIVKAEGAAAPAG
ncbi:MAG: glutamine--tRNA ligase/YqeY domain fusion protein [Deltaproteobacteria bacterium]|nr:glutamine--tRNA ligase/YqeY domain fusion protein [Deltaproteobacteria bacterium]